MIAFYTTLNVNRPTEPDLNELVKNLKTIESSIGLALHVGISYKLKKNTVWTPSEITQATNVIQNSSEVSERLTAQQIIDSLSIVDRAIILVLIDEINILRQAAGMQPRTPAQAIMAIRNKAGTL